VIGAESAAETMWKNEIVDRQSTGSGKLALFELKVPSVQWAALGKVSFPGLPDG
jgi:hypothetical protein